HTLHLLESVALQRTKLWIADAVRTTERSCADRRGAALPTNGFCRVVFAADAEFSHGSVERSINFLTRVANAVHRTGTSGACRLLRGSGFMVLWLDGEACLVASSFAVRSLGGDTVFVVFAPCGYRACERARHSSNAV